jgi:hypothetical protein
MKLLENLCNRKEALTFLCVRAGAQGEGRGAIGTNNAEEV